jgi:hypothetical protein
MNDGFSGEVKCHLSLPDIDATEEKIGDIIALDIEQQLRTLLNRSELQAIHG